MTDTSTTAAAQTVVKRHPIRGILWGFLMGLGLTVVLVVTKVIDLELVPMLSLIHI